MYLRVCLNLKDTWGELRTSEFVKTTLSLQVALAEKPPIVCFLVFLPEVTVLIRMWLSLRIQRQMNETTFCICSVWILSFSHLYCLDNEDAFIIHVSRVFKNVETHIKIFIMKLNYLLLLYGFIKSGTFMHKIG